MIKHGLVFVIHTMVCQSWGSPILVNEPVPGSRPLKWHDNSPGLQPRRGGLFSYAGLTLSSTPDEAAHSVSLVVLDASQRHREHHEEGQTAAETHFGQPANGVQFKPKGDI